MIAFPVKNYSRREASLVPAQIPQLDNPTSLTITAIKLDGLTVVVNQDHSTSQVVWSYGSAPASNRLALGYLNHGRNKISRSPFHVTREDEK